MASAPGGMLREAYPALPWTREYDQRRPCDARPRRGKHRAAPPMPGATPGVTVLRNGGHELPRRDEGTAACCPPRPAGASRGCGIARLGRRSVCTLPAGRPRA